MARVESGVRSKAVLSLVGTLLVASTLVGVVAPARPAAAATVTFGTIQAQMANHLGVNDGTTGNCIRYSPTSDPDREPLDLRHQSGRSAHGARAAAAATARRRSAPARRARSASGRARRRRSTTACRSSIGRMVHYNNPIQANDRYFTGTMNVRLSGFSTTTIAFPWTLDETPNTGPNPNDEIAFSNQISDVTLTQGGLTFRLVVDGFIQTATGTTCPATPAGTPQNHFSTVEGTQTHACLYGTIVQARTLTIVKQVNGTSPPARTFGFTSSSSLAGSPWSNGSFSLAAGGTRQRDLTSGNTVTVTETDPNDDRWTLTGPDVHRDRRQRPAPAGPARHAQPGRPPGGADQRPAAGEREPARHHLHLHQHLHPAGHAHPGQAGPERDGGSQPVDADRHRLGRAAPVGDGDLRSVGFDAGHRPAGPGRHLHAQRDRHRRRCDRLRAGRRLVVPTSGWRRGDRHRRHRHADRRAPPPRRPPTSPAR